MKYILFLNHKKTSLTKPKELSTINEAYKNILTNIILIPVIIELLSYILLKKNVYFCYTSFIFLLPPFFYTYNKFSYNHYKLSNKSLQSSLV